MFLSVAEANTLLDYFKTDSLRKRKRFEKQDACASSVGMLLVCILIMSLMIVKVSSTGSLYQPRKHPTLTTSNIYTHNQAGVLTADPTTAALALVDAAHQPQTPAATAFLPPRLLPIKAPKHNNREHNIIMREADDRPQRHHAQREQTQEEAMQVQSLSHAIPGETANLLERADSSAHEQPIYGTWLTKAKRPQPPAVGAAESAALAGPIIAAASSQVDAGDNISEFHQQPHYALWPRRAATMTPTRSELRDQMPRPPHLASRQPSMVRRQIVEVPHDSIEREYSQPKPFHFPQDGPLPHEFTKFQPHPEQERSEMNNIQDILKQLQLGSGPTKPPQPMVMMPTGLHVAGSFKNFKSSGIANFFRNKRHKKHLQLAVPMQVPLHWMGGYQQPLIPAYAPHQRIAMDQLYSFKPRSPNEINLLAMQQQLKSSRSKNKKKRKQPVVALASPPLLMPQNNQRPFVADPFLQSYPQYMFALNHSQKSKPKRVPFKLNLDIYPVATPTKDYKASAFTLEEAKIATTARPVMALRNPFGEYYPFPPSPASVSAFPYVATRNNLIYNGLNLSSLNGKPTPIEASQSSSTIMNFNGHSNPFYPNPPPAQQPQQLPFSLPNQQSNYASPSEPQFHVQTSATAASAASAASNSNPNSNQLLLHLNVFPKQNSVSPSTNPFFSNTGSNGNNNPLNISRQSTVEQSQPSQSEPPLPPPKLKPRCKNANRTASINQLQKVARSDVSDSSSNIQTLVDFEHPIVALDVPTVQSLFVNTVGQEGEDSNAEQHPQLRARSNFRYSHPNGSVDQMVAEARAAALFRFPVEDLIQFQVDDAL